MYSLIFLFAPLSSLGVLTGNRKLFTIYMKNPSGFKRCKWNATISINNNNNNNNNFIYTVNYPISNTAGINGRTVFMNILTGMYSHICY